MELTGLPIDIVPQINTLLAIHVRSSVAQTGYFRTDNKILNDIQSAVLWGQADNLMSIPTGCDQRDERHGWMGDAQLTAEEAMFNFDMPAL